MVRCDGYVQSKSQYREVRCPKGAVQNVMGRHFCEAHKMSIAWYEECLKNMESSLIKDKKINLDESVRIERRTRELIEGKSELENEKYRQANMRKDVG